MKPLFFLTLAVCLLSTPAAGQVSGPDMEGVYLVGGLTATTQNAEKPWSVAVEGDTVRFEARSGERRLKASEKDRPIDRSELSFSRHPFAFGTLYAIRFEVLFEPGPANSARAMKFFQIHNTNDPGDFPSLGPIVALQLDRERLKIVTRADAAPVTPKRPPDDWRYSDAADIERGRWYAFDLVVRFDPKGGGRLVVRRDGIVLADVAGPIGYNDAQGPYAKMGVYRDTVPETAVVRFRRLSIRPVSDQEAGLARGGPVNSVSIETSTVSPTPMVVPGSGRP